MPKYARSIKRTNDLYWLIGGSGLRTAPGPGPLDRNNLVLGDYIPGPGTCGLLDGADPYTFTDVYPSGGNNYISITTPGPWTNRIYWGEIRMQSPTPPEFSNVIFAGKNPTEYGTVNGDGTFDGNLSGVIKCYGSGYYHWNATDCLIDPGVWMDPLHNRPGGAAVTPLATFRMHMAASAGVHGGRMSLKRVEIKNVQDGVNWVQGMQTFPDNEFTLMEGCWIHKNVYYHGPLWTSTPDGSHSDGFQTNTGRNLTLRGNLFGGIRDETGYDSIPAYNSGDDAWNAEMMFKQEQDSSDLRRLENILIEKNFWWGGTYGINHYYGTGATNFATTEVKDNFFVEKANNQYVIRHTAVASRYTNNRKITVNPDRSFNIGASINYNNGS